MVGITNKIMVAEMRRQQQLSQDIVKGQTQISSGITLTKPSDDALAWVQVSDIGRAQAQQAAWQSNISYGTSRASIAESNLSEVNNLMTRAQELMTSARNGSLNSTSRTAIVEELKTLHTTVTELINQKDYQGVPVFDDGKATLVPVSRGLNLAVVGTRQDVSEGIDFNGTPTTLDDIFTQSIAAIEGGVDSDISTALDGVKAGLAHITVEQAKQGVRSNRLEAVGERLTSIDIDLDERRSNLESTDLQNVIAKLSAQLLQLNASQASFARINQKTLFDILG